MKRFLGIVLIAVGLGSCRAYDLESRLTNQDGLVPPDRFARYGREQAQEVAIAREFGHARKGSSPQSLTQQAEAAIGYARTLPDVADIKADPLGLLLTIRFKSGWRTMITPIENGKRGAETVGLPGGAAGARTGR
jgi:hypothetical protein